MQTADVIIIGSGVNGSSAAYYLAKKGLKVIVLEASKNICEGATSRNGGGVRQSARDVRELPYTMYGIRNIWPNLSEELGMDIEYCQKGNLRLGITDAHRQTLEKITQASVEAGLDVRMISGDEVREICPHISKEVTCASWCPTDGHANPMLTGLAFYKNARRLGVRYFSNAKVTQLGKIKGKIRTVKTCSGEVYEAEHVIVAAGYDSRYITRTVGIDIMMQRLFDECTITEMQPHMFDMMLGTAEGDLYGHQCRHGSFVFGSMTGMEFSLDIGDSMKSTALMMGANTRSIIKYVPALADAKVVRSWAGWCDMTLDSLPVVSEIDEVPGLIVACGFSGHGFGTGPVIGKILSQMVLGEELICDMTDFRYDRFKSMY